MNDCFKLWAPDAKTVELVLNEKVWPMKSEGNGWWYFKPDHLADKSRYGFKVNGEGPFPDPYSKSQPEGVHGLSQYFVSEYQWKIDEFTSANLENAIIYELHIGTFTEQGTFVAAIEKLDHLRQLGITHVELMPVAAFPGKHGWGYDGVDLFSPHNGYGRPDDLKAFVDACHQRNLAVILDVVYNHLGPDGNYLGLYGDYFSSRYHTPWGEAVNFDGENSDQVRKFVIDNALFWLSEYRFDGLRLDAVHAIFDFSALHILEELQLKVEELTLQTGRKLFLIAESDLNDPRILNSREKGGYNLAAQWLDDFHHSVHVLLTQEQQGYYSDFSGKKDLIKCLNQKFVYDGSFSEFRGRRHGRSCNELSAERFVVFLQNHDQIGNRAFGERMCHLVSFAQCQFAAAILLLCPFIPMLFQGEEWAASTPFLYFTDHVDQKLAKAVKEGRKKEFAGISDRVPDPQAKDTYLASKLIW